MSEFIQTTFNYDEGASETGVAESVTENARWDEGLSTETREFVQQRTDEIHGQLKRTALGIIQIGQNLIAVKERLRHGLFLQWLKTEFEMSQPTASRFMHSAMRFKDKVFILNNLPPTIIYALAAPSTPDAVVERVLSGEVEATLSAIKAEKEAIARRADEAEHAREEVEQQLSELISEMAALQRQIEEQPRIIEKPVENPETEAALSRLKEKYAEIEAKLVQKTERVKVLSAELDKHAHRDEQETYRQQVRSQFRQACDAFHLGINQGMARMVTPLDAVSTFEGDDWARLAEVLTSLTRTAEALKRLRESVSSQMVDATVSGH